MLELQTPPRRETPNPVASNFVTDSTNQQPESNHLINVTVYHDVNDSLASDRRGEDITNKTRQNNDENYVSDFEEIANRVRI